MASLTVTTNTSGSNGDVGLLLKVLTGASVQNFYSSATSTGTSIVSKSISPKFTGSWIYGVGSDFSAGGTGTAATTVEEYDTTNGNLFFGRSTSTTTASSAVTIGASSGTGGALALLEIPVINGGSLNEDQSGPGYISASSTTSVTTASFNPPAGSLLVAMVSCASVGITPQPSVSDSIGLGWELAAFSTTGASAGVVAIWVTVVGGAGPFSINVGVTNVVGGNSSAGFIPSLGATLQVINGSNYVAPVGNIVSGTDTVGTTPYYWSQSITPTFSNSLIYGAAVTASGNSLFITNQTGTNILTDDHGVTMTDIAVGDSADNGTFMVSQSVTTALNSVSIGEQAFSGETGNTVKTGLIEIAAAPGQKLSTDSSTAAYRMSLGGIVVAAPPPGALLLLMVVFPRYYTTPTSSVTVTDYSDLNLTWTPQLLIANTGSYGGLAIYTAQMPPLATAPSAALPGPAFANQFTPMLGYRKQIVLYDQGFLNQNVFASAVAATVTIASRPASVEALLTPASVEAGTTVPLPAISTVAVPPLIYASQLSATVE